MKTPHFSLLSLVFAIPAMMLVACSSGSSGGSGTGGTGGGGGGSSGGPLVAPDVCAAMDMGTTADTLSDFEDGAGGVLVSQGRNGGWYTYNDNGVAGPAGVSMCVEMPLPHGAAGAESIPNGPRCASTYAMHVTGNMCTTWGAGVGTDFAAPVPPDGGAATDAASTMPKVPYDVSQFTGVSFWAMSGSGKAISVRVKFPMTDDTKVVDLGTCMATEVGTDKCSDDWGKSVALTTTWKKYTLPFAMMAQEGWGKVFPWTPAHVTSIQFQVMANLTFDFWIDDVTFYH